METPSSHETCHAGQGKVVQPGYEEAKCKISSPFPSKEDYEGDELNLP